MKIERFGGVKAADPEYRNIEEFSMFILDTDQTEYSCQQLQVLASNTRTPVYVVKRELADRGLQLAVREPAPRSRGFKTSDNAGRFEGMHGGGGGSSISGFAGSPWKSNG